MQTAPQNACETQYFNKAMSEIKMLMVRHPHYKRLIAHYGGQTPRWIESAIKQHALFYAAEMCQGRG